MALCPRKYLIKELLNQTPPLDVWVQGTIEQVVGSEILIVYDNSGRAKITKCETADGIIGNNTLKIGNYCCIIGTAISTKGLPEVQASKIVDLTSQPQMKLSWDTEVQEAKLLFDGKHIPTVK